MRLRLAMPVRIGLIMLIGLFAGWLTLIGAYYVSTKGGREMALPSPARLAAVTDVVERTAPSDRAAVIEALTGSDLRVWIGDGLPDPDATPEFNPIDAATFAVIENALAPRKIAILPRAIEGAPAGPFASPINAVEFQIGLSSGETLFISTQSPFLVAAIGVPVGFGAALLGVVIALITLIVLHREFRPLSRLAAAVDTVDPMGEPTELPPIRARSPELRALIAAFSRLQDRLKVLIRGRMALIGGIQHDVRTFATRLRLRVEKIDDPDERERAERDIRDMIHLLDDALLASRSGANELDEELIELAALVKSEVTDRSEHAEALSLVIAPEASERTVLGDRLALRRVIANLVENALKYGKTAALHLAADPKHLVLTIDDGGPGIPVEQRALLLEPFTRIEDSRARLTGGAGLGLAVVRSLVDAHRGSLEIGDAPNSGARLIVRLPIFN